ncbi:MAG: alpha-ketoacid dehydrogenase subunit beta [Candidatus Nanopelagicales bacterium]
MADKVTLAKALNMALRKVLEDDPKTLLMGEDIGKLGGVFRVTDGLQKDFGEHRVVDTPLAESGIIGTAVGLAIRGFRPIAEIQFDGFVYPAFDQIVSQLAKMRARSGGRVPMPVVVRIPFGGGIGAVEHHSESPEAYFAHTAGLRVVSPSNPVDAYWMLQQAVQSNDPVIFFEPKRRYWDKAELDVTATPGPLFESRVVRPGQHCTLAAYGPMVKTCLEAATAAAEDGTEIEVIDLRTISPLDVDTLCASVERTGRLVVVHEASVFLGVGAEVAARVTERCFYSLESPVIRVGGYHTPYPPSRVEEEYLPDLDRVLDGVDRALAY